MRACIIAILLTVFCRLSVAQQAIETDLLIVGGDESGCAAAVQAARLGVKRILLVNDIEWLGGQFCTQGIGPVDEWTIVDNKRVNFPRSGAFAEIIDRIHAHNSAAYGIARPGNSWCGTETIEPIAGAKIFEEWLMPYTDKGTGQITILRGWRPIKVITQNGHVSRIHFERALSTKITATTESTDRLEVDAKLTIDSSDWGDVIRLSGAAYLAGPDLRSRFQEPSAPVTLDEGAHQEMNPISWCPLLRESGNVSTILKPTRYDAGSFADWNKAPPWVEWDGSGGIYNFAGWSIYTHRRMVDRYHNGFRPGSESTILNWPAHDYPLSTLPQHVVDALEETEPGASRRNIVDMSYAQRQIIFEDAKQRSLEFLYWLQTAAHERVGDHPQSFRYMELAKDYETVDRLPPKSYIREGLRLQALYVTRETDVRTEVESPLWAQSMVPDGVFGWQFNMDFHPTRRVFLAGNHSAAWQGKHYGTRNWNSYTDRSMFPLRGLLPEKMNGLIGASKNIGVSSMVQSALRLHGQMMHVGTASGTLAATSLRTGVEPREIAASPRMVRSLQRTLVRGVGGPGVLLWPWHDLKSDDLHFEAANLLAIAGIWRPDKTSLYFKANRPVTRRELATSLVRLCLAKEEPKAWPKFSASNRFSDVGVDDPDRAFIEAFASWSSYDVATKTFEPDEGTTWGMLNEWLGELKLPVFPSLVKKGGHGNNSQNILTRAECVDYLYRTLQRCGEGFPPDRVWLQPGGDYDGDGKDDLNDALPFDRDNNSVPDRLQSPDLTQAVVPFGRRVLVSDYGGNKVAIVAEDGQIEWSVPAEKPQDVWMLANGNVLLSHLRGAREVDMDQKTVWEYTSPEGTEVHGCQPLPGGKVLVVECGLKRLVEVDRDGKIVKVVQVPIKSNSTHNQMRGCRKTNDGRYLISAKADRKILELSSDGNVLRELKTPGDPHEVRALPNGNWLIACGEGEAMLEVDLLGDIVWSLKPDDVPKNPLRLISGFQRLPDGNTVVVNWLGHGYLATTGQFFELDESKRIVRQFTDHSQFVSINKIQLLDVPGDPLKNEVLR